MLFGSFAGKATVNLCGDTHLEPGDCIEHLPHLVRLGVAVLARWMFTRGSPCHGVL
jgi:hypothetical protein